MVPTVLCLKSTKAVRPDKDSSHPLSPRPTSHELFADKETEAGSIWGWVPGRRPPLGQFSCCARLWEGLDDGHLRV